MVPARPRRITTGPPKPTRAQPAGGGGPLAAVFQRQAELALRRAEVGAGHGQRPAGGAALHQDGRHQQCLGHGGAGPILAQEGDAEIQQAKGGGNALVQQIPRQDEVHLLRPGPRFREGLGYRLLLQLGLRLFPALLLQSGVLKGLVEVPAQGALRLFLSSHRPVGEDGGG